ncbi:MAG: hypothetical protein JEZ04_04125 [Spirochaetales bacterium]|nr:hypothetical protein [Spirochaetales bacterium]
MKQKDILVLLLLLLLPLSSFSCTSVDSPLSGSQHIPSASAGKPLKENSPAVGWAYETEITNKGSRSEGSVGRLFYRYNELPPVFSRIVIGGNVFTYIPMVNLWDNSGYISAGTEDFSQFGSVSGNINRTELKNGWYQSEPDTQKKGTPKEWVYAESEVISVWVSPESMGGVIELFNLKPTVSPSMIGQPKK